MADDKYSQPTNNFLPPPTAASHNQETQYYASPTPPAQKDSLPVPSNLATPLQKSSAYTYQPSAPPLYNYTPNAPNVGIPQPTYCKTCNQADYFDAVNNRCLRCQPLQIAVPSTKDKYLPALILTLVHNFVILATAIAAFISIESILISGLVFTILGLLVAIFNYRCRHFMGLGWGLAAPIITTCCFLIIFINNWSPSRAKEPIAFFILGCACALIPVGILLILDLTHKKVNS